MGHSDAGLCSNTPKMLEKRCRQKFVQDEPLACAGGVALFWYTHSCSQVIHKSRLSAIDRKLGT